MRAVQKNILRRLFREMAEGGVQSQIRIPHVLATNQQERDYLIERALSKSPAEVRHLMTIQGGVQYRAMVWGGTQMSNNVWFGDGSRGEADA